MAAYSVDKLAARIEVLVVDCCLQADSGTGKAESKLRLALDLLGEMGLSTKTDVLVAVTKRGELAPKEQMFLLHFMAGSITSFREALRG